jgi:rubrerythrin
MPTLFTTAKVFDAAIQVERNGAAFYRKAAEYTMKSALRKRLLALADAEDGHAHRFAHLKKDFVGPSRKKLQFDPDGTAAHYLEAFVGGGIFNLTLDAAHALSEEPSLADIVSFAIDRERDSIMFYLGIREAFSEVLQRDKVDAIIREEMAHLALLNLEMKKL